MTTTGLFTREGKPHTGAVAQGEKFPYFVRARQCGRCGGAGASDKWIYTGRTCYDCGGSGTRGTQEVRLYTAEQLAKLNATQAKRVAKKTAVAQAKAEVAQAEAAARAEAFEVEHGALLASVTPYASKSPFVADVVRKARLSSYLTEAQAEALRTTVAKIAANEAAAARSEHVGAVGERIAVEVEVERAASFERKSFRGGFEQVWIITMRTPEGHVVVSKTPRFCAQKGERFTLKATVKEHAEYRGERQTVVERISI